MSVLTAENLDLANRIETHALQAWPAPGEMNLDGWRVKISGGFSQRQDSVTPLHRGQTESAAKVAWCERFYNERHLPCSIRLTDLYDDELLEPSLLGRGYRAQGHTHVMTRDLSAEIERPASTVSFSDLPSDDWFGTAMMVDKRAVMHAEAMIFTMTHIPAPKIFVEAGNGEGTVAIGCAQNANDLMGIFSMRTLPHEQRRGYARQVLGALLAWGKIQEVKTAWLQVERSNAAAVALYTALGFKSLYDYRYLVRHEARD